VSIHLILMKITAEHLEQLVAGEADEEPWDQDEQLDIEKSWDVLHPLLLDGRPDDPPRVVQAITGKILVADHEMPYGPPLGEPPHEYVQPDGSTLRQTAPGFGVVPPHLAAITAQDFADRAARISVPSYGCPIPPEEVPFYFTELSSLQEIYQDAADRGMAVAVWFE
jgi:Domain of unknown function (DUF1877)